MNTRRILVVKLIKKVLDYDIINHVSCLATSKIQLQLWHLCEHFSSDSVTNQFGANLYQFHVTLSLFVRDSLDLLRVFQINWTLFYEKVQKLIDKMWVLNIHRKKKQNIKQWSILIFWKKGFTQISSFKVTLSSLSQKSLAFTFTS